MKHAQVNSRCLWVGACHLSAKGWEIIMSMPKQDVLDKREMSWAKDLTKRKRWPHSRSWSMVCSGVPGYGMKALSFHACPIPHLVYFSHPYLLHQMPKTKDRNLFYFSCPLHPHLINQQEPLAQRHYLESVHSFLATAQSILKSSLFWGPPNWLSAPSSFIPLVVVNHLLKMQSMSLCMLSSGSFNIFQIAAWWVMCCLSDFLPNATFWVNLPFMVQSKGE